MTKKWYEVDKNNVTYFAPFIQKIIELTYPNQTYAIHDFYSEYGIINTINKDYVNMYCLKVKDSVEGVIMTKLDGDAVDVFGLAVKPSSRGKGYYLVDIYENMHSFLSYFFNNKKVSRIYSKNQIASWPVTLSTIKFNCIPNGFYPHARKIKSSSKEPRTSMYFGTCFPSINKEKFNIKDVSNCALLNCDPIEEVIEEINPIISKITGYMGFKTKKTNLDLNKSSFDIELGKKIPMQHLYVSDTQEYYTKNSSITAYNIPSDNSIKIKVNNIGDESLYDLIKKVVSNNPSIEYFDINTKSIQEQKAFFENGFRAVGFIPNKGKNLIPMVKLTSFNKEDKERIKELNQNTINKCNNNFKKYYLNDSKLLLYKKRLKQYSELCEIITTSF